MFSVQSLVRHGKVVWQGATEHGRGHTSPAELSIGEENLLFEANAEAVRRHAFTDGTAHTEFHMSRGQPVLVAFATWVPEDIAALWHLATGERLGEVEHHPAPRRRARQVFVDNTVIGRVARLEPVLSNAPAGIRAELPGSILFDAPFGITTDCFVDRFAA
ncbi:hypothetical protein [Amycolatopsis sp. NPDC059657]|uniref:hypothetical protein n=1 Tax=Amycolatopsis sp. NPDC059657 TaxID=3346899 RepID=UPI00366C3CC5